MTKSNNKKNLFSYCYPILEKEKSKFKRKIEDLKKPDKFLVELRIDYLLSSGMSIEEIVDFTNQIILHHKNIKFIATIRSIKEGGIIELSTNEYFRCIEYLYLKSYVDLIDIEYNYYKNHKSIYDNLIKKKNKKIIISMHLFSNKCSKNDYLEILEKMRKTDANILKLAVMINSKSELFTFMNTMRKFSEILKKCGKEAIFIAMGTIGLLSRIWPEFTNTKIVFLTSYDDVDNALGQVNYENYVKYRKLLAKITKN